MSGKLAVVPGRHVLTLSTVLAILGFLVVTAVLTGSKERAKSAPRKAQLVALIHQRQRLVDDLDVAVDSLRRDLSSAQERASLDNVLDREEAQRLQKLAAQAGTVPLRGPGLTVSMYPSSRPVPSPEDAGAYQIHDTDLQLVVNALWAAGAEAIAINGSRLVATTPIRSAGETIIVNFRPLSPPFQISAIGANRASFEASDIARRFKRWIKLFGLGFEVTSKPDVTVPGYTGRVGISAASPGGVG